jgi:mRNA-degrading endonuclease toxin of MazEF toxin-antitoxin module
MITSATERAAHEPTQFLIDINSSQGKQSGLLHTSTIKCENVFTVEQARIMKTIGTLPADAMTGVDVCLSASLGLTP